LPALYVEYKYLKAKQFFPDRMFGSYSHLIGGFTNESASFYCSGFGHNIYLDEPTLDCLAELIRTVNNKAFVSAAIMGVTVSSFVIF